MEGRKEGEKEERMKEGSDYRNERPITFPSGRKKDGGVGNV